MTYICDHGGGGVEVYAGVGSGAIDAGGAVRVCTGLVYSASGGASCWGTTMEVDVDLALVSHCLTALIWGSSGFSESSSTRERLARLGVDIRLFRPLLREPPAVGEELGPPLPSPLYMRWLMALVAIGGRAPETDFDDRRLPRASRRDVDSIRYRSAGSSYVTGDCRSTPPVSRDMISVGLPKETVAVRERSLGRCPDAGGELSGAKRGARADDEAIQ